MSPQMSLYLEIASKKHLTPISASTTFSPARRPVRTRMCDCASGAQCSKFLVLRCLSLVLYNFRPGFLVVRHAALRHTASLHALLPRLLTHTLTLGFFRPHNQREANRSIAPHLLLLPWRTLAPPNSIF